MPRPIPPPPPVTQTTFSDTLNKASKFMLTPLLISRFVTLLAQPPRLAHCLYQSSQIFLSYALVLAVSQDFADAR